MGHVTHVNGTCHIYEWAMSHTWLINGTRMNVSWHIWLSHMCLVMSRMNESCHTWMSHVTHEWVTLCTNESCRTYKCDLSHIWMGHVTHLTDQWHTYPWVMTHINESWLIWMCRGTFKFECVTRPLSYATRTKYDFILENDITLLWGMSHITGSCHTSMSHVTLLWVMSHINNSYHTPQSHVTYICVISHTDGRFQIWMCHVTYEKGLATHCIFFPGLQKRETQRDT